MIIPDVNILVHAFHSAAPQNKPAQQWLSGALNRHETIGLLDVVVMGFLRVMTNHTLFHKPLTAQQALTALNTILEAPNGTLLSSSPGTWTSFTELVRLHKLKAAILAAAGKLGDDAIRAHRSGKCLGIVLSANVPSHNGGISTFEYNCA